MKRKGIIFGLALATLFSVGAGAAVCSSVPTEPITAVAETTEISVSSVQYNSQLAYRGEGIYVAFNVGLALGDWDTAIDASKVLYKDSTGASKTFNLYKCGDGIALRQISCAVGDSLTIQAGFTVNNYEVKETVSYVCKDMGAAWVQMSNEEETVLNIKKASGGYDYDVYLWNETSYGLPRIQVNFETAKTFAANYTTGEKNLIVYTRANGETLPIYDCINLTGGSYFNVRFGTVGNAVLAGVGDVITFKKGFALAGNERLAEDISFMVMSTSNSQMALLPEVKTVSLTLNGKIGLNFKFALDGGFVGAGSSMQVVYKKGDTVVGSESLADKTADANGAYVCTYPIVTKDYQDEITAEVQDVAGNVLASQTYSIVEYAEAVKDGDYSAEAKALVEKTVAYCEAARAYFAGETVEADETAVDLSSYAQVAEGTLPTAVTGVTASLRLEAGTELRLYIYAESMDGITCTVGGEAKTPVKAADGKWYVVYDDVAADKLGDGVTFVITDGETTATLTYSALSYANYVLNDANAEVGLVNTVKAMYAYSVATADYVQSLEV